MHASAGSLTLPIHDANARGQAPRRLRFLRAPGAHGAPGHDARSKATVAAGLAELLGYAVDEPFAADGRTADAGEPVDAASTYLVPQDTLVGATIARDLGLRGVHDLFGGVVPQAFVATKAITHPLWPDATAAPAGWSPSFCDRVDDVVLPGYTVFDHDAARAAGRRLLQDGPVRLKDTAGVGGLGQVVVRSADELDAQLATIDVGTLVRHGWVLECDLREVETFSVGQVQVGRWTMAYIGTQHLTRNRRGERVYGGSRLRAVRGGFDQLMSLDLPLCERLAIHQARTYHQAAVDCFDGFFASRCNYDVARGLDARGRRRSGVLEQSWRIGGASSAELTALRAFRDDAGRHEVRVENREVHGDEVQVPDGAWVYYSDVDPDVGRLTKYAVRLP